MTKVLFVLSNVTASASGLTTTTGAVGHELGKLLSNSGVGIAWVAITQVELDPKAVLNGAVQKEKPSHVFWLHVPSATLVNGTYAKQFNIRAEVVDAATAKETWKYSADVASGMNMRTKDVAASMFERMRRDGLL